MGDQAAWAGNGEEEEEEEEDKRDVVVGSDRGRKGGREDDHPLVASPSVSRPDLHALPRGDLPDPDSAVVGARGQEFTRGLDADGHHATRVPAVSKGRGAGERLQGLRARQLGDEIIWVDIHLRTGKEEGTWVGSGSE